MSIAPKTKRKSRSRFGIHRLCGQCLLAATALSVLPMVAMSLLVGPHVSEAFLERSRDESGAAIVELSQAIQDQVEGRQIDARTISCYPPISGISRARENGGIDPTDGSTLEQWRERLAMLFSGYASTHPGTLQVRYLDADGVEWLRIDAEDGETRTIPAAALQDKSDRAYFQQAASLPAGECYVSPIDLNVDHGWVQHDTPVMRVSTPVWRDGQLEGVLVLNVSAETLLNDIALNTASGRILLATESGVYMSHDEPAKCWGDQLGTDASLFHDWPMFESGTARADLLTHSGEPTYLVSDDGETHLTITRVALGQNNRGWIVGIERDTRDVIAASRAMYRYILLTALVVGVLAMLVSMVISTLWIKPLKLLARAADQVRRGDYSARVPEGRRDELGDLARSFNDMADEISRVIELEEQRASAEAANYAKSEFLANMSHEIRTPMTAILGFTDLLADASMDDDERASHVKIIRRNGDHMLRIINDILDLSKIEAGKMGVELIDISIENVVSQVTSLMRGRAEEKNLQLGVSYLGEMPSVIKADPVRLRQVLLNLLGNAIKFTQKGSVRILIDSKPTQTPGKAEVSFAITDTGPGIEPDTLHKLFMPFSQADDSTTRRFGGTGLGLTLSKRFAEMLGGDITVESNLGQGSTFTLTICVDVVETPAAAETDAQTPTDTPRRVVTNGTPTLTGRVLLAEDGPDNQRLIGFLLRKTGVEVDIAENGQIAVDRALAQREAGKDYDVILMDMQMPELDGYGATKALRSAGYTGPIVALTAHAMSGDRDRCLAAGCDDYATKPIEKQVLYQLLSDLLISKRRAA